MSHRDRDNKPSRPEHSQDPQRADHEALPCIGCGYDLTGIVDHAAGEVCPECAAPIADSVEFHRLHANDPARYGGRKYVARLQYSSVAMALYAPFAAYVIIYERTAEMTTRDKVEFFCYMLFVPVMVVTVALPALLVFTGKRAAALERPRARALRRAIRGTLAIFLLLTLLLIAGLEIHTISYALLLPALFVVMPIATLGVCYYYLRIAREVGVRCLRLVTLASCVAALAGMLLSADLLLSELDVWNLGAWAWSTLALHVALSIMFIVLTLRLSQVRSRAPSADE